jgi:hypothetical protein
MEESITTLSCLSSQFVDGDQVRDHLVNGDRTKQNASCNQDVAKPTHDVLGAALAFGVLNRLLHALLLRSHVFSLNDVRLETNPHHRDENGDADDCRGCQRMIKNPIHDLSSCQHSFSSMYFPNAPS